MKYVIVRCEDNAPKDVVLPTLIEGAKTPHLQLIAQTGAAGLLGRSRERVPVDRQLLHGALLGLPSREPEAQPALWYAAHSNLQVAETQTAWCAEFVTQQDDRIIDPLAGRITTKESEMLIQALDDELGSDVRQWFVGQGSHHLLLTQQETQTPESSVTALPSQDLLSGKSWRSFLPRGHSGEALELLITQAASVLERHPVNRVRIDLGENPANLVWFWGPANQTRAARGFTQRTGLSGVILSHHFPMAGLARILGLRHESGIATYEETSVRNLAVSVLNHLERADVAYVHLKIESMDPVDRLCAMERIDQHLLKTLSEALSAGGSWRLLVALDDRPSIAVPVIAMGSGLPRHPIASLSSAAISESPLEFHSGADVFGWFIEVPTLTVAASKSDTAFTPPVSGASASGT